MKSLISSILGGAAAFPERTCTITVHAGGQEERRTFAEVARDAERAAASLAGAGVRKGDIVTLIGTHHIDFHAVWLGAVWVGAIPSVLPEPSVRVNQEIYWRRLLLTFERLQPAMLLIDPALKAAGLSARFSVPIVDYKTAVQSSSPAPAPATADFSDPLILQHSSGTTGLQKAVILSQQAVLQHCEAYANAIPYTDDDVIVTWLPLYHDAGLIGCFVVPLLQGLPVVSLSPFEWVANPLLLLDTVTKHSGTMLWLPNFSLMLLAKRAANLRGAWELSSLRVVLNGSEPITSAAMKSFTSTFTKYGLRADALHSLYGMAENVLAITRSTETVPPRYLDIDNEVWSRDHKAAEAQRGRETMTLVSSGIPVRGVAVRIADQEGKELPRRQAGRILIRSSFMFTGYFKEAEDDLFDGDGYFDTGDLGFIDEEGHLYVTGRGKELIIVGGRNVYPHDIEETVNEVSGVYPGRTVCFGVENLSFETEAVVVIAESASPVSTWPDIARKMRQAVASSLDLDVADAKVVSRGEIQKSTSGKLARSANRRMYLEGKFGPVPAHLGKLLHEH